MLENVNYDDVRKVAEEEGRLNNFEILMKLVNDLEEQGALKWFLYLVNGGGEVLSPGDVLIEAFNTGSKDYSTRQLDSLLEKAWLAIAFNEAVTPRLDKDIQVLLSQKESLIYFDEFGDKITSPWADLVYNYSKSKLSDLVYSYLNRNKQDLSIKYKWFLKHDHFLSVMTGSNFSLIDFDIVKMVNGRILEIEDFKDRELKEEEEEVYQDSEGMLDVMSGHDFEKYLADKINNETSMHAEVTQGSGDQGADLIVRGMGFSAVIQAKHYAGKVGNKAIQEAFSARQYYGTGLAIVVANNGYTKSAWQLAEKTGVLAMNENSILTLLKTVHR
ncbi:restriction endonuclease [Chromohalobacter israelensis]|uniref:restriction endonuclease n=1 Tax=Chromohalobacter israelensis TaxID=141390 RepID=UPI000D715AAF|nr:restriction endonuclease [Chromohalobacter salexigens]PWW33402.1 restriction endonuclease [Chromohalobacter salexigens]